MASGGARSRSGPAPDPNALRRDRKSDAAGWTILPSEGRAGDAPEWPLFPKADAREAQVWADLWRKPQAVQWDAMGQVSQVAMYARRFCEAEQPGANHSLSNHVRQLGDDLGMTVTAMLRLRWKIATDETATKRAEKAPAKRTSSRDRLKVVNGDGP